MNGRLLVGMLLSGFILFIMDGSGRLTDFRAEIRQVYSPLGKAATTISSKLRRPFEDLTALRSGLSESMNIEAENQRLKAELALLVDTARENEALRREIGLLPRGVTNVTIAFVVGRIGAGAYNTIIIDRGIEAGIRSGDLVLSNGIVIGRITAAYERSAEVTPITNVNAVLPGFLEESQGTGIIRGTLRGVVMSEIPLDVDVRDGERVVTSAVGAVVPSGFYVGSVEGIKRRPGDLFLEADIRTEVKPLAIDVVTVIRNR